MTDTRPQLIAIGSYTPGDATGATDPAGLTTWWWDGAGGVTLAGEADLPSPSFTCWHPSLPMLYAVSELDTGVLTVLAVGDDGRIGPVAGCPTGGSQPCWVTTDPGGTALLIANYAVGDEPSSMTVIPLDEDGYPVDEPIVVPHTGSGPVADRQQHAHVHQVVPTAEGTILASDLGADALVEYRIDTADDGAVSVTEVGRCEMPPGSGPRHITLAAAGRTGFVSGELDATITVIERGADGWAAVRQVPSTTRTHVATEEVYPSQVMLTSSDRYLVVANRGPSTLAVLDVTQDLEIVREAQIRAWPRHFTIAQTGDDRCILAACQHDDAVEAVRIDAATGDLTSLGILTTGDGDASPLRAPSCVAVR